MYVRRNRSREWRETYRSCICVFLFLRFIHVITCVKKKFVYLFLFLKSLKILLLIDKTWCAYPLISITINILQRNCYL